MRVIQPAVMAAFLVIAVVVPAAVSAQADPAAVVQRYRDALNRGDVAGAVALLTDDVIRQDDGGCAQVPCVGGAAVQKAFERVVAVNVRTTPVSTQVSGNTVTFRGEVRSDNTRAAGVERFIYVGTYEVRGDKIAAFRIRADESDPQTATYRAFIRARGPSQPLPRTGGSPTGVPVAVAFAAVLLLTGLALRRWRLLARL